MLENSPEELYENAPCGYLSTLADGTFVKVNQTFLTWTGYAREDLLYKKRWNDLLTLPGKIYLETHYNPLMAMQGYVNEIAFDIVCKNGDVLPVLINGNQVRTEAGVFNRTTVFNASERRRYEQELLAERRRVEQVLASKARLLAMLSHEIRNPLHAISCIAELLEMDAHSAEQQKYAAVLKSSSQSLLELINDILDFSKLEADKIELEVREFDLYELLHHLIYQWEPRAERKGLNLQLNIDEGVPRAYSGDPVKIKQILTNLLSNAIKFTHAGHVSIDVKSRAADAETEFLDFRVVDSGIGIEQKFIRDMFEEYSQASPDISEKYGGTGLGLAIVRKLLKLHNSDIQVETVPDHGSVFSFTLRLRRFAFPAGVD